jgi:hypothetical protein
MTAGVVFHNYSGAETCKSLQAWGGISFHKGSMLQGLRSLNKEILLEALSILYNCGCVWIFKKHPKQMQASRMTAGGWGGFNGLPGSGKSSQELVNAVFLTAKERDGFSRRPRRVTSLKHSRNNKQRPFVETQYLASRNHPVRP